MNLTNRWCQTVGDVVIKVLRYLPDKEEEARYDRFVVDAKKNMTVLDALFLILTEQDPSI